MTKNLIKNPTKNPAKNGSRCVPGAPNLYFLQAQVGRGVLTVTECLLLTYHKDFSNGVWTSNVKKIGFEPPRSNMMIWTIYQGFQQQHVEQLKKVWIKSCAIFSFLNFFEVIGHYQSNHSQSCGLIRVNDREKIFLGENKNKPLFYLYLVPT